MAAGINPAAPHHSNPAGMGPGVASDPAAAGKQDSRRSPKNLGNLEGLANLREARQRGVPTHGTEKTNADPRELLTLDPATRLAIVKEIKNGTKVDPARKRLHNMVIAHLNKQLEATDPIAPGVWATGFSHVRLLESDSAVTEDGWANQDLGDALKDILDETIAFMSGPNGPPPPTVFTFEQVAYGKPPTQDPSLKPQGLICGRNGYGDPTMVMSFGNHLRDLMSNINRSHDKKMDVGSDEMAPHRVAWIVALHQIEVDDLSSVLDILPAGTNGDAIKPLVELANKIKQDGLEKFIENMQTPDDGTGKPKFRMTYPAGSEHVERDCEKDLLDLSKALLGDMKTPDGCSLLDSKDTDAALFVTALLNRLEVNGTIEEENLRGNGLGKKTLSIGKTGADIVNDHIGAGGSESLPHLFASYVLKVPIIVISDKAISLRMPKQAHASEKANASEPDEAKDPSGKPAAEEGQSANGSESTPGGPSTPETPSQSRATSTNSDASAGSQPAAPAATPSAAPGFAVESSTPDTDNAAGAGTNPTEAPPPTTPPPAPSAPPPGPPAPWDTPDWNHG